MPPATAMVLVGSTGAGTTFLSQYVADRFDDFAICRRVTTRDKRPNEATGAAYRFIDEPTFQRLLAGGQLAHVKFSDFDNTKYGIEDSELTGIVQRGQRPILTCHSVEEAQTLRHFLLGRAVVTVCIYVYSFERDRKRALTQSGEINKHTARYHLDIAFKIQAHRKQFADCNYVIANRYDSQVTTQVRTIVSAIRSGNFPPECDTREIRTSVDEDIREIQLRIGLAASEP